MEAPRPMDRLVCGDVGFGKTEVLLRAAVKAVLNLKQVLVLVPTTILADQHFSTFTKRCDGMNIHIACVSRLRSSKENKHTLQKVLDHDVDIVIGTHRLLQDDVAFKDLGLIIIDEEQRFGVNHKEKLKKMAVSVECNHLCNSHSANVIYVINWFKINGAIEYASGAANPFKPLCLNIHQS